MLPLLLTIAIASADPYLHVSDEQRQVSTYLEPADETVPAEGLEARWLSDAGQLAVSLSNNTPHPVEVDWNRSAIRSVNGETFPVLPSLYEGAKPGSVLPPTLVLAGSYATFDFLRWDTGSPVLVGFVDEGGAVQLSMALMVGDTPVRWEPTFTVRLDHARLAEAETAGVAVTPFYDPSVNSAPLAQPMAEPPAITSARLHYDEQFAVYDGRRRGGVGMWATGLAALGVGGLFSLSALLDDTSTTNRQIQAGVGAGHLAIGTGLTISGFMVWSRARNNQARLGLRP